MMNPIERSPSTTSTADGMDYKNKFKTFRLKDFKLKSYLSENVEKESTFTKIKRESKLWRRNPQVEISKSLKIESKKGILDDPKEVIFENEKMELKDADSNVSKVNISKSINVKTKNTLLDDQKEGISESVKVKLKDSDSNVLQKNIPKSLNEEVKDINFNVSKEEIPSRSNNQKYRSMMNYSTTQSSSSYFHERIMKAELNNIPELPSPIVEVSENEDLHSSSKVQNNLINYLYSKKKAVPGFSCKFLESFASKSVIVNENPASLCKLSKSADLRQTEENISKLKKFSASKIPKTYLSSVAKKLRTKSLIKETNEYVFTNDHRKSQSFSFGSLSKIEKKCFANIKDKSDVTKKDSDVTRSDRTFTMYSHPFFKNQIFANDVLQRLHNIKRFNSLKVVSQNSQSIPRNNSSNTFLLKNVKQVKELKFQKEPVITNSTEENKNDEEKGNPESKIKVVDEYMVFEEYTPVEKDLIKIPEMLHKKITILFQQNFPGFIFGNISLEGSAESISCVMEKLEERKCNSNEIIRKESITIKEEPKKHIYVELLLNVIPQFINDTIENVIMTKSSNSKVTKVKPKQKIKKKVNKMIENAETTVKIPIDNQTFVENDLTEELPPISNSIVPETEPKIMEENTNINVINSNTDVISEKDKVEIDSGKSNEMMLKNEEKMLKRKQRYVSNFSYFNEPKSVDADMFNINWKDEVMIPDQVKRTILRYDAHMRKLTEERKGLFEENMAVIELNKSLQKRNGVMSLELKQQKRETAFIKNQITVMLSRMQSIPDKLEQLEIENTNLKSEISDLERTLDQRDQLFTSERQMNASLSEEIVKLESDSVNKELMKNVCEEFENLNDEYENLKKNIEETEDKLFEIVQDRDNLVKHATLMEENLYKLKAENNYLIQNYNLISSSGMVDPINGIWNHENRDRNYDQSGYNKPKEIEGSGVDTKYSCRPEKESYNHHHCRHSKHRSHSRKRDSSDVSSTSSSSYSDSSSDYKRKHKKKRKHSHKHKHHKSHSHKDSNKKDKSGKGVTFEDKKHDLENQNQNANIGKNSSEFIIKMPQNKEELKKLEIAYDKLQAKKDSMETALSHIPINKGISNSSNLTSMQEQESLEKDLNECDKQLASLRKILRDCKVFKTIPPMN